MDKVRNEKKMKLLLINSSDKYASCSFYDNSELFIVYADTYLRNPKDKKQEKLVMALLELSYRFDLNSIDAIAVTIGPGSFTGLRVGISVAKGVAFAMDKKIVPVNNFHISLNRLNEIDENRKYCVLIQSKSDEYYYCTFKGRSESSAGTLNLFSITEKITSDFTLVGDFDDETVIKHNYFEVINLKNQKNEIESLAELAALSLPSAKNAEEIEPLYVKDFKVKTNALV
ncbi:MAG: tRNA (adenosine(37)-N6)-threonylcarbamoyltransferase complex dimerization subunit type 1 TsaB [Ignavibacteria bacterium]|nr:tRNA (adenosine(37)-N6)-threonylcarbamoyltransferase complex dimerization subunit type 1 TsaB [Ignavibacteria bacterium]